MSKINLEAPLKFVRKQEEGNSDLFTRAGLLAAQLNPIQLGLGPEAERTESKRFFLFLYFYFCFLQKYIFDLEIYRNIPRPPRCGAAVAYLQKKDEKNCRQVPGDWSPGSWAAGLPGRPATGRPAFFLQFSPFREIISHMCSFCNFLQK